MADNEREQLKQRRRALIKAAGAAPVVFSLTSGSAVAATSLTCKDKSQSLAQTDKPAGALTDSDKWMRFKVQAYRINQSGGQVTGFTLSNSWYKVDQGVASVVSPNGAPQPISGQFFYLLVDYVSPTQYKIYPASSPVVSPIAGASCWNSLTGAHLTNPPNVVN